MNYIKAQKVLPDEILKAVQEYIDGECIYIPRKSTSRKAWGEKSGYRKSLKERNRQIFNRYLNGATAEKLAGEYFLSEQSIKRIIYCQRKLTRSNSIPNHS